MTVIHSFMERRFFSHSRACFCSVLCLILVHPIHSSMMKPNLFELAKRQHECGVIPPGVSVCVGGRSSVSKGSRAFVEALPDVVPVDRAISGFVFRSPLSCNGGFFTMSNELVRSAMNLSLSERRLASVLLAKLQAARPSDEEAAQVLRDGAVVHLDLAEFAYATGMDRRLAHRDFLASINGLRKCWVEFKSDRAGWERVESSWFFDIWSDGERNSYLFQFHPRITRHVFGLKGHFMKNDFVTVTAFRSLYALRLYEMLCSWRDTGRMKVGTDDFCKALDVPKTARSNFAAFRRDVLDRAIDEIKRLGLVSSLEFSITAFQRRRVTELEFRFRLVEQGSLVVQ